MKKYNILVTGVGAIVGYGIIRSLRKSKYDSNIIGTDIYEDAAGRRWCDGFEKALLASDPGYTENLARVIESQNIDLVIPGIEQDIDRINRDIKLLAAARHKFAINNSSLIELSADKWETQIALEKEGFKVIRSFIDGEFEDVARETGLPMLMKLRKSYASKGQQIVGDADDYYYWKKKAGDNFMVQQIVGDDDHEYTVSAFGYGDGMCSEKICLQRKLSGEGATAKAKLVNIERLNEMADKMCGLFNPVGPTNFQFRLHEGEYLPLEINPRISSATSIRAAFGYNEAEMCVEYFCEGKRPAPKAVGGGRAIRYIEDLILYDGDNF